MKFKAIVNVMPLKELLDPQGKAVCNNIANIGVTGVTDIRIGKRMDITFEADSTELAEQIIKKACDQLLCNKVMESYTFEISQL